MNRDRTLVLVLVVVLLLACLVAICVGGLIAGGAIARIRTHRAGTAPWLEREDRWMPAPRSVPRGPQGQLGRMRVAALVVEVPMDGPADDAGIVVGDLILDIEGEAIQRDMDPSDLLSRYEPGDRIELLLWRDGREHEVQVRVGRRGNRDLPYLGLTYRLVPFPEDLD